MSKIKHEQEEPHRIIMSDDDSILISNYSQALELEGYDVQVFTSVDKLVNILSVTQAKPVDLFVIDIMQPPGKSFKGKSTDSGNLTGLYLAHHVRRIYPSVPIILFSLASLPNIRKSAERLTETLDECILLKKGETLPNDLVNVINRYFLESKLSPSQKHNIFRRLYKSLMLQPNISGIGIDLKELRNN